MINKRKHSPKLYMSETPIGNLAFPEQPIEHNLGTRFLDEALLPAIEEGLIRQPADVFPILERFKLENAEVSSEFELIHAWLAATERDLTNDCLSENSPDQLPENDIDIFAARLLLERLIFSD